MEDFSKQYDKVMKFLKRHAVWFAIGAIALLCIAPAIAEIRTILLTISIECLAIGLSGVAIYTFTAIDFTKDDTKSPNPGLIFLGVHLLVGLTILGVYLAQ